MGVRPLPGNGKGCGAPLVAGHKERGLQAPAPPTVAIGDPTWGKDGGRGRTGCRFKAASYYESDFQCRKVFLQAK